MDVLSRAFGLAAFMLPALGCILIAPDDITSSDHCPIPGTTDCSACLKANCQGAYDACCTASDCRNDAVTGTTVDTYIGAVDDCATGSNCSIELSFAAASTQGTSLKSCMQALCRTQCQSSEETTPVANPEQCEFACTAGGTGPNVFCKCVLASLKSGATCETETLHDPSGQATSLGRCCINQLGTDFSCTCDLVSDSCGSDTIQVDSCEELDMEAYATRTETCVH